MLDELLTAFFEGFISGIVEAFTFEWCMCRRVKRMQKRYMHSPHRLTGLDQYDAS